MQRERDAAEHTVLLSTASEYRRKGYEVAIEAPVGFLPGVRADLIATKQDDKRVIEVKTRSSLRTDPSAERLACAVEAEPGWSFDPVLVPEHVGVDTPENVDPLALDDIRHRLIDAESLFSGSQPEAAVLLAWSGCEAAVRRLLAKEAGGPSKAVSHVRHLLSEATMHGAISRQEHSRLKELASLRNAVIHGFCHGDGDLREAAGELIRLGRGFVSR